MWVSATHQNLESVIQQNEKSNAKSIIQDLINARSLFEDFSIAKDFASFAAFQVSVLILLAANSEYRPTKENKTQN